MADARERDRRVFFRMEGIDWNDDEAIDAWALAVWRHITAQEEEPLPETTILTDRYAAAVQYATIIHATQLRKGTSIPYLAHVLGVSSLVLEAGGSEDEAIAGLLHDAVEDCGGMLRLADVRARFGETVADIVLACSDSTDEEWKRQVSYAKRKNAYLKHLATADPRAVLVSLADKVHNARAIVTDLQRDGVQVLRKFNGTPKQILRYYRECLRIGEAKGLPDAVILPLRTAVAEIASFVEGGA